MNSAYVSHAVTPPVAGDAAGMPPGEISWRPLVGLAGIFVAAMMAGLNNRVGALALADIRGVFGFGFDSASWITTAYSAGELIAMPFSAWFAITLSLRRFSLFMLGITFLLALIMPFVHDLDLFLSLRFLQGIASGTMIPLLMMAALKFLPSSIRLHGLGLYAMTATFAPNLSIWLVGFWLDVLVDWRWVYWQIIPMILVSAGLIAWGLPSDAAQTARFKTANWVGMAFGVPALVLIAVALDQGTRMDWLNSSFIMASLLVGLVLMAVYLLTEWYHPSPFIKLQILARRNLWLGFTLFIFLLVVLMSSSLLPASYLGPLQEYRHRQMSSIGLIVALPQLLLGSGVALLLYQKWVDARIVFGLGLFLIALACFSGAQLTSDWNRDQFVVAQVLQALGQPMAVIATLFLSTSVVHPSEGPYVSGVINTLRAVGVLVGAAVVGQFLTLRGHFHAEMLLEHAALATNAAPQSLDTSLLTSLVGQQSLVMSIADAYRLLGILSLLLIPLVLRLTHIPAPDLHVNSRPLPSSHG